jgi:[acyl-carrier-protein] S-malonyltransferase
MPRKAAKRRTDSASNGAKGGLALLFPGQGSQQVAMGRSLASSSPAAREVFDSADEALGFSISRVCFEAPAEELEQTANAQPAILATSVAQLAALRERLGEMGRRLLPSFVAGHSMGQFSAATAAGSLDLGDALRLVQERARIMADWAKQRPGGLAAVLGLSEPDVQEVCDEVSTKGDLGVAGVNAPGQTVIAGELGPLAQAIALAKERGARVMRLPISVPGHLPVMEDAARELGRFIGDVPFRDPETPIVSNISARVLTTASEVRGELSDQLCSAVHWARCVMMMVNSGAGTFVEVGPGQALSNLVRRIRSDADIVSAEQVSLERLVALGATVPAMTPVSGHSRTAGPAER